jgi:hypothetical protein
MHILSAEIIKQYVTYDPETGEFINIKKRRKGRPRLGEVIGRIGSDGYVVLTIEGREVKAHRVAWAYMTGEWPSKFIDHKNMVRTDNRFCNLREATKAENMQNQRKGQPHGKSGLLGVGWHNMRNRWSAQIGVDNKKIHLGLFDTPEEAHAAYLEAKKKYHPFQTII